jgi:prevent-host-death family protein
MPPEEYLTIAQAAAIFERPRWTVWHWIQLGKLPATREVLLVPGQSGKTEWHIAARDVAACADELRQRRERGVSGQQHEAAVLQTLTDGQLPRDLPEAVIWHADLLQHWRRGADCRRIYRTYLGASGRGRRCGRVLTTHIGTFGPLETSTAACQYCVRIVRFVQKREAAMAATTTAMPISDARKDFASITNRVAYGRERLVLTSHGRAKVAVIPASDLELLEAIEDQIDLTAARAALAKSGTKRITLNALKAELDL